MILRIVCRWKEQYPEYHRYGIEKDEIRDKLCALDLETATVDDIANIIGDRGWVTESCDECGIECQEWLHLGQEPDYDARWYELCRDCAKKIGEIFDNSTNKSGVEE